MVAIDRTSIEIDKYFRRIFPGNYRDNFLLSSAEEEVLIRKAKSGDQDSWMRLMQRHKGMMVRALKYVGFSAARRNISMEDLVGEFISDAQRRFDRYFDPDLGYKFTTFIFNRDIVHGFLWRTVKKYSRGSASSTPDCYDMPLPSEGNYDRQSTLSLEEFISHLEISKKQNSLASPADYATDKLDYEQIAQYIEELPDRLKYVLKKHSLEEVTFEELGNEIGITRAGAHQIYKRAIDLVRGKIERDVYELTR